MNSLLIEALCEELSAFPLDPGVAAANLAALPPGAKVRVRQQEGLAILDTLRDVSPSMHCGPVERRS